MVLVNLAMIAPKFLCLGQGLPGLLPEVLGTLKDCSHNFVDIAHRIWNVQMNVGVLHNESVFDEVPELWLECLRICLCLPKFFYMAFL